MMMFWMILVFFSLIHTVDDDVLDFQFLIVRILFGNSKSILIFFRLFSII